MRAGRVQAEHVQRRGLPEAPGREGAQTFTVDSAAFLDTVSKVARAASRDESRPVLTGVLVHFEGSKLVMAATDSYRMSVKETELKDEAVTELEAIVPARALTELSRIAQDAAELQIGVQENHVVFGAGDVWLTTRRIDGQFPNYKQLIPETFEHEMALPREEFLEVVRRASVMAQRNSPLRLRFAEGEVTVSAQTQDVGEARESLPVPFTGEPLEIGFNPEFLRDGLESVDTDEIALRLISPLRPGLLRSEDEKLLVPDHADPSRGLIVRNVTLRDYRSYASLELELQPGLVLAVGENGAGKTNLLEALHVGTQGFSPRSRNDAQLVRFGAEAARIELAGDRGTSRLEIEVTLRPGDAKKAKLNGASLRAAEQLRSEVSTLVFTPDRLVVVKGGPAARRAYFDRALGRLYPARASLPAEYGAAVAQRNAALRRVAVGASSRDAVAPWTERVAELGAQLVVGAGRGDRRRSPRRSASAPTSSASRTESSATRRPRRRSMRSRSASTTISSAARRASGRTSTTSEILAGDRDLRRFGSQGEQRLAVLSLILAEAALLAERGPAPPLLLLDDVLSELDEGRRTALARRLAGPGQTLITATGASALPVEPAPARAGDSRGGEVKPERIGGEVQSELARFGPAEGMTEIVRVLARGGRGSDRAERLAGAACRDRTLHVATSSSAWAFELAQLEPKLLERLREALGDTAPAARCGSRPESFPSRPRSELEAAREALREPTAEERELAAALAAGIEDESLRKIVAKAALASLAEGALTAGRSGTL